MVANGQYVLLIDTKGCARPVNKLQDSSSPTAATQQIFPYSGPDLQIMNGKNPPQEPRSAHGFPQKPVDPHEPSPPHL